MSERIRVLSGRCVGCVFVKFVILSHFDLVTRLIMCFASDSPACALHLSVRGSGNNSSCKPYRTLKKAGPPNAALILVLAALRALSEKPT